MKPAFDVCIRGAGVVGQSLALLLAGLRLRVGLVETHPNAAPDVRAFALNAASKNLLQSLRCWPSAEHATPVQRMRVWGDGGAQVQLPAPTLWVMQTSAFFVRWWWLVLGLSGLGLWTLWRAWQQSTVLQAKLDRALLRLPVFGPLLQKACIARWTRTLSTMFAAGVPLMEALDAVAGTAGNSVYSLATARIQRQVSDGVSLNRAMAETAVFPAMLLQMCSIGEESGALDHMLAKAAGFFEDEVDQQLASLASLLEPFIIVTLGVLIGGIVVAMYLPIFQLGQVS